MSTAKIRFAIIGYGWRAKFYCRVAKEINSIFELAIIMIQNEENIKNVEKDSNICVTTSFDKVCDLNVDFIVLCVPVKENYKLLKKIFANNIPVLCETPVAETIKDIVAIHKLYLAYMPKIQIAEQYLLSPYYIVCQKLITNNIIGSVSGINISTLHDYHAIAIIRRLGNIQTGNCTIWGKRNKISLTLTNSKNGKIKTGAKIKTTHDMAIIDFDNKIYAIFDYTRGQYFSDIRSRHVVIKGDKGEINNLDVLYINNLNEAMKSKMNRVDLGVYGNNSWSHYGISFENEYYFLNPYTNARLNDDEIAVANCLVSMKNYVETCQSVYNLEDALKDTYLSLLMKQAIIKNEVVKGNVVDWQIY